MSVTSISSYNCIMRQVRIATSLSPSPYIALCVHGILRLGLIWVLLQINGVGAVIDASSSLSAALS